MGSVQQMNIVIDRVGAGMKNQDPKLLGMMLPVFRDAYPDIIYRSDEKGVSLSSNALFARDTRQYSMCSTLKG